MGDIVNAVADVFGFGPASKQADAATDAARMSSQSSADALALQRRMYEENVARQQPFMQAGQNALNKLAPLASEYTPFGMAQFQQDPGYAFRLSEGMKTLERGAAARGGLLSGATMKGLQRYGQDMASQEYQNAFNRYGVERERRLNPLQSLAGVGQTSTQQVGGYGQNYANQANQIGMTNAANQGNLALGMGNIRASQYGTAGSALNTALNTDYNALARRFGYGGGGMQAGGQINPVSGEYMGSLEF
jgi:hypothetical protein